MKTLLVINIDGCRHCGEGQYRHGQYWAADTVWHPWTEPTDQQRAERAELMRERLRDLRGGR